MSRSSSARVADFLPLPLATARAERMVKVTMLLSARSVEYFKRQSAKHSVPYQALIRRLVDEYVDRQERDNE